MRWMVSAKLRPMYHRERPGTHCTEGWALRGAENLAATGIRSPVLPARSELLYRLGYPGPTPSPSVIATKFLSKTVTNTEMSFESHRMNIYINTELTFYC